MCCTVYYSLSRQRPSIARHYVALICSIHTAVDHQHVGLSVLVPGLMLNFHGSSFLVASSWRMSRGYREHDTRISGVSDVSDKDVTRCYSDLSATSRACRARGIWRTTRHTDKRAALHRSRPPADQSGKRVASWTGKLPDTPYTRDILPAFSRGMSAVTADATRKLLPWNLSFRPHSVHSHLNVTSSHGALAGRVNAAISALVYKPNVL